MNFGSLFRLDRPIGPCLITILYWIAVVVIVIGTLLGIAGGLGTMTGHERSVAALANASPSANANGPGAPGQNGARSLPANSERGFEYRRYHGYGFHNHRRPGWVRSLQPLPRGSLYIAFSLLRGLVAFLIVRVLAEIGLAILAMGARARQSA